MLLKSANSIEEKTILILEHRGAISLNFTKKEFKFCFFLMDYKLISDLYICADRTFPMDNRSGFFL